MVWIWGKQDKRAVKFGLGEGADGAVTVIVRGNILDTNLVYLGAHMAKGAKRRLYLTHVIEVPRVLPLPAVLTQEYEYAHRLLDCAIAVANRVGCDAVAHIVQARDAGSAIVDEAEDYHCALLLIGLVRDMKKLPLFDKTITYVLANAHCRVWFIQELSLPTQSMEQVPVFNALM